MASRRDQLQAYQFLTQRVISAFVMRETDPQTSPLRRGIGAVFGGVMVAVIVAAVFGIYGIFTRLGGDDWRSDGSVVIERETGASFVYAGGELRPALNYASAMLASGRANPPVFRVSASALAGADRGVTIGIPGAPTSLPTAGRQLGLPWTLCTEPATDPTGTATNIVTLLVAGPPAGRQPVGEAGTLVVDAQTETTFLLWQGHRYRLREPETVVPAAFGAMVTPAPAGISWLNALPAGVDIGPLAVRDRGEPATAVTGREIGELLVAETGSGPQHYLVVDDGLAAVTPLQAAIETAQSARPPTPVPISEANAVPRSELLAVSGGEVPAPRTPPGLAAVDRDEMVCAATRDPAAAPEISIGGSTDLLAAANPTGAVSAAGASLADRVYVPAGRAAVVRAVPAPGAVGGTYHVVTDVGVRYPVPSPEVLPMLGYESAQAVDVPASLVARLPQGPTLDPVAAVQPAATAPG